MTTHTHAHTHDLILHVPHTLLPPTTAATNYRLLRYCLAPGCISEEEKGTDTRLTDLCVYVLDPSGPWERGPISNLQSPILSDPQSPSSLGDYLGYLGYYYPLPVTRACLTIHPPPTAFSFVPQHHSTDASTHALTHARRLKALPYQVDTFPVSKPVTDLPTASYTHTHTPHSSGLN